MSTNQLHPGRCTGKPFVRKLRFASLSVAVLVLLFLVNSAGAQIGSGLHAPAIIPRNIDEGKLVRLTGNTRPEANAANDRGPVPDDLPMEHMLLQLRRTPEQEKAVEEFINQLHTAGSANFQQWITAQEFGGKFGLAKQDLNTITRWLSSHGFIVNVVYPSGMLIDFSGTAGQVRVAFHTAIHHLDVKGAEHIANMSDPWIPTALAPAVSGVVSLHDFRPHTMHKMHRPGANYTLNNGLTYAVVPADLATIYNLNPLFNSGYSGQGQTIAVIEDSDVFSTSDWNTFRSTFGLANYTSGSFTTMHPAPSSGNNNCSDPGVVGTPTNTVDAEAILDAEWASAAAPSAAIELVSCADTKTTFGGLIAIQNLINAISQPPAIMSISYGQCETENGAAANAAYNSAYQQAVAEGVSVFVAAGDNGAAGCDTGSEATLGINVNGFASTPYNVAVGGTDFGDTYSKTNSTYWSATNGSTYGSAISYIPEIPWNDSCAGVLFSTYENFSQTYGSNSLCNVPLIGSLYQTTVAGGGGPSGCATGTPSTSGVVSGTCQGWPKPAWQSVLGNPNDGVRDIPDISLFASNGGPAGLWGHYYVFCWSDTTNGGAVCTGDPSAWTGAGGTSFAAPIMAGIQALINQKTGARQGNPNPTYYQLAASEYGLSGSSSCNSSLGNGIDSSCLFYDVTLGDMDVDCTGGNNCYLPSGSVGVLSTSDNSYMPAYGATTGWDFATGIGSINAANLVNHWPASAADFSLSTSPTTVTITQGVSSNPITITVNPQNGFSGSVSLSASGLPNGVTASFNPTSTNASSMLALSASGTAATGTATVTITGTTGTLSHTTQISLTVTTASSSSVAFVKTDTTTQGNWKSSYGADGYNVIGDTTAYPSYATVTPSGQSSFVWASSTSDIRALEKSASTSDRIAATWYSGSSFTVDVNLTDGKTHQLALYCLDWDNGARAETISISDATTGTVLDGRSISSFVNGEYLVWNISGHVTVTVTLTGGSNPVVSGIFFGGSAVTSSAAFLKSDTTTQGNWKSSYGADGYNVVGDTTAYPAYATVAPSGQNSYVWASSTSDIRALEKSASISDRIAATWYSGSSFAVDVNLTDGKTHQLALYCLDWDNGARAETISISDATTGTVLDSRSISSFVNGEYLVWNISGHVTVTVTLTGGSNPVVSGIFFGGSAVTSSAAFVKSDTTTQGNWKSSYGADGYNVVGDTTAYPAYATVAPSGQNSYVWASSTSDIRALEKSASISDRIAATWYSGSSFAVDVNLTDGKTHQLALYCLDWDNGARAETISISDATTGTVLDSRSISSFVNGEYLVWNISGHVTVTVTLTGGSNPVVSGIFFGGSAVTSSAAFVKSDTTTQGNWKSSYGADGYNVVGDTTAYPAYATVAPSGQNSYVWASSTSDIRALEKSASTSDRIAATWYSGSSFAVDVNLTDGKTHQLAIYCLDWDNGARAETISISDATTGTVLDSRSISSFVNGEYLVWNISGHVTVTVTLTGGSNPVVSGIFF